MRRSLERIYRKHRQGMYSLALSITRRPQAAEDAVQEAFVKLWRLGPAPRGDPVAYTYAAVRNAANDGFADQAASASILSSFSLTPLAQPCHRGIVIERASR